MNAQMTAQTNAELVAENETSHPQLPLVSEPRMRLEYLDGLRGVASLYVVMSHLPLVFNTDLYSSVGWLKAAVGWTKYGHTSVSIFIVLSGYCLMLPVARSSDNVISGGFWKYIVRRGRRIIPPYYAALVISLALLAIFSSQITTIHTYWSTMRPVTAPVVLSHFLLIHNFSDDWITRIDAPMWSVATEWQIYFLFPLILLPLMKKSTAAMLAAAVAISVAPMFLFRTGEDAQPWFTILFSLGMIGASVNFSSAKTWSHIRTKISWGPIFAFFVLSSGCLIGYSSPRSGLSWKFFLIQDTVIGIATMTFLVFATNSVLANQRNALVKVFDSPKILFLGAISYSLYLLHVPIICLVDIAIRSTGIRGNLGALCYLVLCPVAAVGGSYLFYLAFEKPFTVRRSPKNRVEAVIN